MSQPTPDGIFDTLTKEIDKALREGVYQEVPGKNGEVMQIHRRANSNEWKAALDLLKFCGYEVKKVQQNDMVLNLIEEARKRGNRVVAPPRLDVPDEEGPRLAV